MPIHTKVIEVIDGKTIHQISATNQNGVTIRFLTLGATWQAFEVPLKNGELKNLLLGFDLPSQYQSNTLYAAQTIGRTAGRIAKGTVTIDGQTYQLPTNNNGHTLHGGPQGFHAQVWEFETAETAVGPQLQFFYRATEAIDGYPGDLSVKLTVTLTDNDEVQFAFEGFDATAKTLFNPTTHPYFNLGLSQALTKHRLTLRADHVLETDEDLIPTGNIISVADSVYDFRQGRNLGQAILESGGYDDAFVLDGQVDQPAVVLTDSESGDSLEVYSGRQGVVIYTMNSLDEGVSFAKDGGQPGKVNQGVAIEPQYLPDAVNHPHFDQTFIKPGEHLTYQIKFVYKKRYEQ